MKTKTVALFLTLMFGMVTIHAQDQEKSKQQKASAKTEKPAEISKSSSEPCCPEMKSGSCCEQSDKKNDKMDHSQMDSKGSKVASVVYTCPMHPDVKSDKPGKCPKCGMDLVKKK